MLGLFSFTNRNPNLDKRDCAQNLPQYQFAKDSRRYAGAKGWRRPETGRRCTPAESGRRTVDPGLSILCGSDQINAGRAPIAGETAFLTQNAGAEAQL